MSVLTIEAPAEPVASAAMTPEEMLRMPDDGKLYELVDGQLVEKLMSDVSHLVANNLNRALVLWDQPAGQGLALVEATFRCFAHDPGMVRRPDVAYIAPERLATYAWGRGHFTIVPDLAVEVVSQNDEVLELDRKISDYLRAGVRRVWVINPELQILRIHRAPGDLSEIVGDAILSDEALLPGFRCPLPSLFARPAAQAEATAT